MSIFQSLHYLCFEKFQLPCLLLLVLDLLSFCKQHSLLWSGDFFYFLLLLKLYLLYSLSCLALNLYPPLLVLPDVCFFYLYLPLLQLHLLFLHNTDILEFLVHQILLSGKVFLPEFIPLQRALSLNLVHFWPIRSQALKHPRPLLCWMKLLDFEELLGFLPGFLDLLQSFLFFNLQHFDPVVEFLHIRFNHFPVLLHLV